MIPHYLSAYGPATPDAGRRLAGPWPHPGAAARAWFEASATGRRVDVDGEHMPTSAPRTSMSSPARPTAQCGYWAASTMGPRPRHGRRPGRAAGRRASVSRRAAGSRRSSWPAAWSAGTWELNGDRVRVGLFGEAGTVPRRAIGSEAERLSSILGRDLRVEVAVA